VYKTVSGPEKIPAVLDDDYFYKDKFGEDVLVKCPYDFDARSMKYNPKVILSEHWRKQPAGTCKECGAPCGKHSVVKFERDVNAGDCWYELSARTGYCESCIEQRFNAAVERRKKADKKVVVVDSHESCWPNLECYEVIETYSDGSTWAFSPCKPVQTELINSRD